MNDKIDEIILMKINELVPEDIPNKARLKKFLFNLYNNNVADYIIIDYLENEEWGIYEKVSD